MDSQALLGSTHLINDFCKLLKGRAHHLIITPQRKTLQRQEQWEEFIYYPRNTALWSSWETPGAVAGQERFLSLGCVCTEGSDPSPVSSDRCANAVQQSRL